MDVHSFYWDAYSGDAHSDEYKLQEVKTWLPMLKHAIKQNEVN